MTSRPLALQIQWHVRGKPEKELRLHVFSSLNMGAVKVGDSQKEAHSDTVELCALRAGTKHYDKESGGIPVGKGSFCQA